MRHLGRNLNESYDSVTRSGTGRSESQPASAMSASTSGLSSVVSKLTRASFGASVSSDVKDSDLDRYVADLIMREAKSSEERYKGKEGIRAYLPVSV